MATAYRKIISLGIGLAVILALVIGWPINRGHDLDHDFSVSDEHSTISVDHLAWDQLLKKYVIEVPGEVSKFAYGSVSTEDKSRLKDYLANLQQVQVTDLSTAEQMAYWINLYNALTIDVVLAAYPVDTIKKIDSPLLRRGPWRTKRVQVQGEKLSLDDIEHAILRPIYQDPRIHYGVNCASIGCPNLQAQAYTAANIELLLDQGAEQYVNHPRGVSVAEGNVTASSIYDWFAEDFGTTEDLFYHLMDYANDSLAEQLAQFNQISDYQYDWSINDKP